MKEEKCNQIEVVQCSPATYTLSGVPAAAITKNSEGLQWLG